MDARGEGCGTEMLGALDSRAARATHAGIAAMGGLIVLLVDREHDSRWEILFRCKLWAKGGGWYCKGTLETGPAMTCERRKSYGAHVSSNKPSPGLPPLPQAPLLITMRETGRVFTYRLDSTRFSFEVQRPSTAKSPLNSPRRSNSRCSGSPWRFRYFLQSPQTRCCLLPMREC